MFPAFTGSLSAEPSKMEHSKRRRSTTPVPESQKQATLPGKRMSVDSGPLPDRDSVFLTRDLVKIPRAVESSPVERLRVALQSALSQTTYGKDLDALLSPERQFQAISQDNGDVVFLNYSETPRAEPPFKGVCNDLSYSFGQFLKKMLGQQNEVRVAKGTCKAYFPQGIHYFLLAWPKAKHQEIMQKMETQPDFPEDCLMVDPSFKNFCSGKHKGLRDNYQVQNVQELAAYHPDRLDNRHPANGWAIPIGFLRNIAPEMTDELVRDYGREALLYLQFNPPLEPGGTAVIQPVFKRGPQSEEMEDASALLRKLPADNRFRQFYDKVLLDIVLSHKPMILPMDLPPGFFDFLNADAEPPSLVDDCPMPDAGSLGEDCNPYDLNPFMESGCINPALLQNPSLRQEPVIVNPPDGNPSEPFPWEPFPWLNDTLMADTTADITKEEPMLTNEEISRLSERERKRYFQDKPLAEAVYAFWQYDTHHQQK